MRHALRRFRAALALALLVLTCAGVHALPEDRLQAIAITAERAVRDEKRGYTVYSGDVVLEQGSLHIEADRITIFHDLEAADRIVAIGQPARMRQRPALDKGLVTASAGRIVYEKSRERVTLIKSATIEQDGSIVSGESIDYFMAEQRVRADAAGEGENARVKVFIPAAVVKDASDDKDGAAGGNAPQGTTADMPVNQGDGDGEPASSGDPVTEPAINPGKEAPRDGNSGGA